MNQVLEISENRIYGVTSSESLLELYIDDFLIQSVRPKRLEDGTNSFEIVLYDQWRFASPDNQLCVMQDGKRLAFPDGLDSYSPIKIGKESKQDLLDRFARGQKFDDKGRIRVLAKAEDMAWQEGVLELFKEVSEVIYQVTGSHAFIYSGTLLGYVRENGFISFDKDMDCAYLSKRGNAAEAAAEFALLGRALLKAGYSVNAKASCISVRRISGSIVMVDIAHLFRKEDGAIGFPFGTVGQDRVDPGVIEPTVQSEFMGHQVRVPKSPELLLEQVYGKSWRVPNPNFSWVNERRRRDPEALLSYSARSQLAADDFYSHSRRANPSRFAAYVLQHDVFKASKSVIDLGSGDGEDSILFGKSMDAVLGIDRSIYSIRSSNNSHRGVPRNVSFTRADILDSGVLSKIVARHRLNNPGPILFYARFLLHSLTQSELSKLFALLSQVVIAGDSLALEFRTLEDRKLKKRYNRSFRNFIDSSEIEDKLQQIGFKIVDSQKSDNYSKYGKENPVTSRLLAVRK
ncbi:hypothetical protein ACR9WD_07085 [Glutamicibacter sp. PAEs-4]|uniref:hypothetical protein n=1 Tax=Glutamicibacter sp. PAEs-4 TaxID=3444114 RepID=UPI003EBCCDEB